MTINQQKQQRQIVDYEINLESHYTMLEYIDALMGKFQIKSNSCHLTNAYEFY